MKPHVIFAISAADERVQTYAHVAYWGWTDPVDGVFVRFLSWRPRVPRSR